MAPSRTACRSLERSIADPSAHERIIAAALAAHASGPAQQAASAQSCSNAAAIGRGRACGSPATPGSSQAGVSPALQASKSGSCRGDGPDAASVEAGWEQGLSEADQLLAEAASFGADEAVSGWWVLTPERGPNPG